MSRPTPVADPEVCPGCYTLDCYCKYENPAHGFSEFPHGYTGRTHTDCARQAKAEGWRLYPDGTGACPKCVIALRKPA